MVATASLYPFQREGAAWLALHHVALLADDMGLGKTLQAISAADMIEARRILVALLAAARTRT
jgi:SNF2 family DNA or RNA helicase